MTGGASRASARSRARSPPGRWRSPISIMTASRLFRGRGHLFPDQARPAVEPSLPRQRGPHLPRGDGVLGDPGGRERARRGRHRPQRRPGSGHLRFGNRRTQADPEGPGTYGRARLLVNDGHGRFREADLSAFTMRSGGWNDEWPASPPATSTPTGGRTSSSAPTRIPAWRPSGPAVHVYLNDGPDAAGLPRFRDVTGESGSGSSTPSIRTSRWPTWTTTARSIRHRRLRGRRTRPAIWPRRGLWTASRGSRRRRGCRERTPTPETSSWEKAGNKRYWPVGVNGDFDGDGDTDMFVGEWFPELPSRLFVNTTPGGRSIAVEVDPPGQAFGALVNVYEAERSLPWTVLGRPGRPRGPLVFSREVCRRRATAAACPAGCTSGSAGAAVSMSRSLRRGQGKPRRQERARRAEAAGPAAGRR